MNPTRLSVFLSSLLALLPACAGQIPPPGGPEDTVPPEVVFTEPDTNAVNVVTPEIRLEFSEYVDRRSVEDAVFMSPYAGGLEFDWSGTTVTLVPREPLRDGRTYVVTVGTDVVDRRGKNRMASGFTLAFSTGDSIDRGVLTGRVVDAKAEGVLVFAYLLDGRDRDTLNPARVRPDYVMQTGTEGKFTLSNLAMGTYRVFAVRDQVRDYLYQPETDEFGVLAQDVQITAGAPEAGPLLFRLSREDTSRPFLTGARATAPRTVTVNFSEPVDSLSVLTAGFVLEDSARGGSVAGSVFALDRKSASAGVLITTAPLDSGVIYRLSASGIRDLAGNHVDSSWVECLAVSDPDTLPPSFLIGGRRDSLRDHRPADPIPILFSEPVRQERAAAGMALQDTQGRAVTFGIRWISAAECLLVPVRPLEEAALYRLGISGSAVEDYYGNRRGDTSFALTVSTLDPRRTGVAEGRVTDMREQGRGEVVIRAEGLGPPAGRDATAVLAEPGPFRFERLPEGNYKIRAFRDADSSGTFSPGRPFPWAAAERFTEFPDTVKVRARWNAEGVNLILR